MEKGKKSKAGPSDVPAQDTVLPDYNTYLAKISEVGRQDLPSWRFRKTYDFDVLLKFLAALPTLDRRLKLLYSLRSDYAREGTDILLLIQKLRGPALADIIKMDDVLLHEINELDTFEYKLGFEIEKYERYVEPVATTDNEQNTMTAPLKPQILQRQAMILLDELFPNLEKSSNKAKAEFLALLTGWSAEKLRSKWSYDYRFVNPEQQGEDIKLVMYWKKRLRLE